MTFTPRDLSIHIQATSKPNLVLNGGPKGATFPGWFLTVQQNEGYDTIAGPAQLTKSQIDSVAEALDNILGIPAVIRNAVGRCDAAMRDDLTRQLEAAERAAAKIPELRARLGYDVSDT